MTNNSDYVPFKEPPGDMHTPSGTGPFTSGMLESRRAHLLLGSAGAGRTPDSDYDLPAPRVRLLILFLAFLCALWRAGDRP